MRFTDRLLHKFRIIIFIWIYYISFLLVQEHNASLTSMVNSWIKCDRSDSKCFENNQINIWLSATYLSGANQIFWGSGKTAAKRVGYMSHLSKRKKVFLGRIVNVQLQQIRFKWLNSLISAQSLCRGLETSHSFKSWVEQVRPSATWKQIHLTKTLGVGFF